MSSHPSAKGPLLTSQGAVLLEREAPHSHAHSLTEHESVAAAGIPAAATKVNCSGCEQPIAYQAPIPGEPVGIWLCQTCGAVYYGDDAEAAAANAFGVVRAAGSQTNPYLSKISRYRRPDRLGSAGVRPAARVFAGQ